MPTPLFVKPPVPDITPLIVSSPESPVVKIIPFAKSTLPLPLKELIVSLVSTS